LQTWKRSRRSKRRRRKAARRVGVRRGLRKRTVALWRWRMMRMSMAHHPSDKRA
jgi:hypothetical protein